MHSLSAGQCTKSQGRIPIIITVTQITDAGQKSLEIEGHVPQCPIAGNANENLRLTVHSTSPARLNPFVYRILVQFKAFIHYWAHSMGPAVPSVTRCRCRRRRRCCCCGHRRVAACSGEWAQHFSNASCLNLQILPRPYI